MGNRNGAAWALAWTAALLAFSLVLPMRGTRIATPDRLHSRRMRDVTTGQPVPGIKVFLVTRGYSFGEIRHVFGYSGITDDHGDYVLYA
jgi:hypothetical protein